MNPITCSLTLHFYLGMFSVMVCADAKDAATARN